MLVIKLNIFLLIFIFIKTISSIVTLKRNLINLSKLLICNYYFSISQKIKKKNNIIIFHLTINFRLYYFIISSHI